MLDVGDVLSFAGGEMLHGGDPLLYGIRYILAVFLFLEKDNENGRNSDEEENILKEIKKEMNIDKEGEGEVEGEEKKVKEERIESIDYNDKADDNRSIDIELKEEEEEEISNIFIKSFLSCYRSDPQFILNPVKSKDLESKTRMIIDDNLNSKNSVYHTESSQSTFSFGFDFIE
jgi:hypothetical protein